MLEKKFLFAVARKYLGRFLPGGAHVMRPLNQLPASNFTFGESEARRQSSQSQYCFISALYFGIYLTEYNIDSLLVR